jgi:homocysteine S-methyltransferase
MEKQGFLILDGGLATDLENRGHDLNHPLWSARLLLNQPDEIVAVHRAYMDSGSDCIISSSYQATISGFVSEGLSVKSAKNLIKKTVAIAQEARDDFLNKTADKGRLRPVIAASIGPYGAYLANGAEYRGDYKLTSKMIKEFHLPRWELLTQTAADLFACETIPNIREAEVLNELLYNTPDLQAWMSFSCNDGGHISDGTPIEECVSLLKGNEQLIAIGINCTAPAYVLSLIKKIARCETNKKIIVYPNSGERFNPGTKRWDGVRSTDDFSNLAIEWFRAGACIIGGCCRTGPDHISAIRNKLEEFQLSKSK